MWAVFCPISHGNETRILHGYIKLQDSSKLNSSNQVLQCSNKQLQFPPKNHGRLCKEEQSPENWARGSKLRGEAVPELPALMQVINSSKKQAREAMPVRPRDRVPAWKACVQPSGVRLGPSKPWLQFQFERQLPSHWPCRISQSLLAQRLKYTPLYGLCSHCSWRRPNRTGTRSHTRVGAAL